MNVGEGATPCFWLDRTDDVIVTLRRFTFSERDGEGVTKGHRNCPANTRGHDASTGEIARTKIQLDDSSEYGPTMRQVADELRPPHDDPRWPTVCASCGEPFQADDEWQVNQAEVYIRADTGAEVAFRGYGGKENAGALFDAWWLHRRRIIRDGIEYGYVGPDGIALVAVCPNGVHWEVDGPSSNGPGWTRTGSPRDGTLSVTPSILTVSYHGWLGVNGAPPSTFSGHLG